MESIHPLKAYRDQQRPPLTQQGLARLLGVTKATVCRWETGTRKPELDQLLKIADMTGIPGGLLRPDLAPLLPTSRKMKRARATPPRVGVRAA